MSKSISLMIFQFGKIKAFYVRKPDKCLGMIVVIMLSKQYTILYFKFVLKSIFPPCTNYHYSTTATKMERGSI